MDSNVFSVSDGRLWLDNVYFAVAPARPTVNALALSAGVGGNGQLEPYSQHRKHGPQEVFATNVTYHGDAASPSRAFAFVPAGNGASILFQGMLEQSARVESACIAYLQRRRDICCQMCVVLRALFNHNAKATPPGHARML